MNSKVYIRLQQIIRFRNTCEKIRSSSKIVKVNKNQEEKKRFSFHHSIRVFCVSFSQFMQKHVLYHTVER